MTPQEQSAIEQLRANFDSIHDNLDALLNACDGNDALKRQLGDAMQEALDNYVEAQNRVLGAGAPTIEQIAVAAKDAQTDIDAALASLQNIKSTLNAITKAVKTVGIVVAALP